MFHRHSQNILAISQWPMLMSIPDWKLTLDVDLGVQGFSLPIVKAACACFCVPSSDATTTGVLPLLADETPAVTSLVGEQCRRSFDVFS